MLFKARQYKETNFNELKFISDDIPVIKVKYAKKSLSGSASFYHKLTDI
jgi:hypothetical protein